MRLQSVDHDVADAHDGIGSATLGQQVLVSVGRRRQQQIHDRIGDRAIHLLGHRPVARAQAGLDVPTVDPRLRAHDRRGHRAVHVAHDQHRARPHGTEESFQPHHHCAGLLRVRARADSQIDRGSRHTEILEEDLRHRLVVVLPRVYNGVRDPRSLERGMDRRRLHEIRPRPDDRVNHTGQVITDATAAKSPLPAPSRGEAATLRVAGEGRGGRRDSPGFGPSVVSGATVTAQIPSCSQDGNMLRSGA